MKEKKWDFKIRVIGIRESEVDDTILKVEEFILSLGLKVEYSLGEESEDYD